MINVAVMGYGTVGSGVVEVVNTNGARIKQRIGEELNIKYVLDLKDFPGNPVRARKKGDPAAPLQGGNRGDDPAPSGAGAFV